VPAQAAKRNNGDGLRAAGLALDNEHNRSTGFVGNRHCEEALRRDLDLVVALLGYYARWAAHVIQG
jgi:hypothetical protein